MSKNFEKEERRIRNFNKWLPNPIVKLWEKDEPPQVEETKKMNTTVTIGGRELNVTVYKTDLK